MLRIITTLLIVTSPVAVYSQNDSSRSNTARVDVVVTDMNGKPSRGEQILFKADESQKTVMGLSDAGGKFSVNLPVGDKYVIKVKSLTDTTKYGMISIPALGADQYYSEPFKVNVKFEAAKKYTLDNVHFDFGKATLRTDSYGELEELVSYMKNKEEIKIEIAGHTDNIGKADENLRLSQQRADAIRAYVIRKGIAPARIVARGYGATEPVATNATEEGRQLNRRTEVRVMQ